MCVKCKVKIWWICEIIEIISDHSSNYSIWISADRFSFQTDFQHLSYVVIYLLVYTQDVSPVSFFNLHLLIIFINEIDREPVSSDCIV